MAWFQVYKRKKIRFYYPVHHRYQVENISTDALATTWDDDRVFVAKARVYHHPNIQVISEMPISFQFSHLESEFKYYAEEEGNLTITLKEKPSTVYINNKPTQQFTYDEAANTLKLQLSPGEGIISFK